MIKKYIKKLVKKEFDIQAEILKNEFDMHIARMNVALDNMRKYSEKNHQAVSEHNKLVEGYLDGFNKILGKMRR